MGREGRGRMIWGLGVLSEDLGPSLLSPTFFPYYLTRWILSWIGPGALSGEAAEGDWHSYWDPISVLLTERNDEA